MAMTESTYAATKKENLLEISAADFYFDTMRPYLQEMLLKCRTDGELGRTIEKVINSADSFCARKDFNMLAQSFDTLEIGITDKNYFNGVMKKAPEEERQMVRSLIEKISDLRMIIQCEEPQTPNEPPKRERIGYRESSASSPNGENEDYSTHNMNNLNQPKPGRRIPNV